LIGLGLNARALGLLRIWGAGNKFNENKIMKSFIKCPQCGFNRVEGEMCPECHSIAMTKPTPTDAATPRQWKQNGDSVVTADFQLVSRCAGDTDQEVKANAALIVRAVNLLEAHEAVAEQARVMELLTECSCSWNEQSGCAHCKLSLAIQKLDELKQENK